MNPSTDQKNTTHPLKKFILGTLLVMLLLIGAWHILLPLLGLTIVVTAALWPIAVASIVVICAAILLFFIFTGVGVFVVGFIALVWTILAIILFPILFPILIPLLLLMLVLGVIRRNRQI